MTPGQEVDRKARDTEDDSVLRQVQTHGGFSAWWAGESMPRAKAIVRLEASGRIRRMSDDPKDRFPWAVYRVVPSAGA